MTVQDTPPPAAWREAIIHSSYVRVAITMAESLGVITGVRKPEGSRLVPFLDVLPLLDGLGVAKNPHVGVALGAMVPAALHGSMGYAAVSSPTIGDAMATIARYAPMRNRLFTYRFSRGSKEVVLSLKARVALQGYEAFLEIATAVSIFKIVQGITGDNHATRITFDSRWEPDLEIDVPMKMRYSQNLTALRVPLSIADMPTLTADGKLYASACRSCEEELKALEGSLAARLRSLLHDGNQQWLTVKEAAQHLSMSPRTLIRKLVAEGLTYQALLDEAKGEMACWYLRNSSLPVGRIAERLGFLNDTNFSRSFRRWRGMTPLEYRISGASPHATTPSRSRKPKKSL